MIIPKSEKPPT